MPYGMIPILAAELVYAIACVTLGTQKGAPLWLSWPNDLWGRMLHGARPAVAAPRPDYARIASLERELGMAVEQPEKPMRTGKVCLVKDCDGDTYEVRTWSGQLATRIHQH